MGKPNSTRNTKTLVGLAIFTAIVVVLQLLGSFIKIGSFSISLVLIPIVIGAAVYGPRAGAYLGGVFGLVVAGAVVTGYDPGGYILFLANPFLTILLCLVKGVLAGYVAGISYQLIAKKNKYMGVIVAAILCPVVNTGIFIAGLVLFFKDILVEWAAGTSLLYFTLVGLVGVNFLIEMLVNVILSPAIFRIINVGKKSS